MSLTEEESNFLRFYLLNVKTASKAVRAYFDTLYPSSKLASELKINYHYWKNLPFITSPQRNILYPGSGNIVKSEQFDITLMICLLRNMQPCLVPNTPPTGWDDLPKPTNNSYRADLARVKYYRNFVAHHKTAELSASNFTQYWRDLEQAIGRLGGSSIHKEAQSVRHVILDTSLTDILLELRHFEKSLHEQSDKINFHQSEIDSLMSNKEEQEQKIHQLNVSNQHMEAETQKLTTNLSDYKDTIDSCTKEIEACEKGIENNTEMIKELQDQAETKQNEIDNLITKVVKLEIRYEQHEKMLKEHEEHLTIHDGQIDANEKSIDEIKQKLHGTAYTSVRDKQQRLEGRSNQTRLEEDTRALIEEDVREGTFVITKAVTDGLLLLKQNGVLLITGYAGTGKSRIGRHILHMYCTDNISYKCIKLNALNEWEDIVSREHNVVILLDDIFGETNCIYNREKDTKILDKVYAYVCKGNIKVIITIRDTVKRQCQEVFDSHRLFQYDFIDLSSCKYLLSWKEKKHMLMNYMKTVRKSDFIESKGYVDCKGDLILTNVENITWNNPVKGFPLVVYQFVHNDKYFKLGSKFFDRPTEAMLEEMNAIRRKGEDQRKFMIQYAVMVYTAINENCINPDDKTCVQEVINIIDAIYGEQIEMKKCHILDAVNELRGSHLINIPNQKSYKLHHPTLQESVILSFAQTDEANINKIIPLISWSFFKKMVKPKLYIEKEGEVVLRVSFNSYKLLADRLKDIYIEKFGIYQSCFFIHDLCNTEIFLQDYSILLPCLLEALEKEDGKDKYTENMIKSSKMDFFESKCLQVKNKDKFLAVLLATLAKLKSQLDIYNFVLKTFETIIKTSSHHFTIGFMKSSLISSLYLICSTKDVRSVKATLDKMEEHKIPVLLDQCSLPTSENITIIMFALREESDDGSRVFLTLCIWNAYKVCNIPVLEFLLSKYVRNPFDINLFFKMIYQDAWIGCMTSSSRKRFLDSSLLSLKTLKWMIETFQDQELENPNFILRFACKHQMFEIVEYMASRCKTIDEISCLQAFVDKTESEHTYNISFNKKIFDFLIKRIDITSKAFTPVVKSVIKKQNIPDYMCDAFLPICINNANLLTLACENGQFYLVNLIIEGSHIEQLDIQSALIAACRECEKNVFFYHEKADCEIEKFKIVKYMFEKVGFEQFDLKAVCQQPYAKRIQILEWFVQNIAIHRLDVYTIINSTLVNKRSDILEHIMNKVEIESLDKWEVLKSVSEQYTAECSTTILEIVRTIWDSTEDKEVLHMKEIVNTAYESKSFELLMWIHENCHPHISIDSKKVLMLACAEYRSDVAKWVLRTFEQTSLDIDGGNLFRIACSNIYFISREQLIEMVKWILASFQIKGSDFISGVLELISVNMRIRKESSNLVIDLLKKYFSILNTDDIKEMINKSLEQNNYFIVNWFLEERTYCSFDKQMVLNKACLDKKIDTIKMLSKYFYALDMTQAMIKVCTSPSCLRNDVLKRKGDNADQSVACLSLLWNEVNKIRNDSIDIRTLVRTVCKEKNVSNNVMTWILLNLPLDQIPINEVLITCCQQGIIQHVEFIVHKVAIEQLDIRKAFVKACQAFPGDTMFQVEYCEPQCINELYQKERNQSKYLMIVDSLFQMQSEKDSSLKLVLNEMIENKKFDLILYFLQAGYCRNIDMNDLLKTSCRYGQVKLVQWIVVNVEHKDLDIKSAIHEAYDGLKHAFHLFHLEEIQLKNTMCLALMWHYIHDISMFEIDTVLESIADLKLPPVLFWHSDYMVNELKTWLLYIKNINHRICQFDKTLLNTEENINLQSQQVNDGQCCVEDSTDNDDLNSRYEQDECLIPTKKLRFEREEQK